MAQLAQQPGRFHPAEDFFDAFAAPLTDRVARMPRRARIDRALTRLLRDVRRDAHVPTLVDEARGVVRLVAADGDPDRAGNASSITSAASISP